MRAAKNLLMSAIVVTFGAAGAIHAAEPQALLIVAAPESPPEPAAAAPVEPAPAPLVAPPPAPAPQTESPTPPQAAPQPAATPREETFVSPGWTITVRPGCESGCATPAVSGPSLLTYEQAYASIPFRRAEYEANPGYRHDAAMELLFGAMRPTTVVRHPAPMTYSPSDFWTHRLGLDRRQFTPWYLQNWQTQPLPRLLYY